MTDSRNVAIVTSIIVLSILAIASNAGATLIVDELSGTFGAIEWDSGDPALFDLTRGEVSQPAAGGSLVVLDIAVDVTGWTADGDPVTVIGGTVTIESLDDLTTAVFNVSSASLTQILTTPPGMGYMSLDLTLDTSNLTTDTDGAIDLPPTMQMFITYNGLVVDTDGTASLNALASASFSAIPEPATLVLLVGGFVLLRRFR